MGMSTIRFSIDCNRYNHRYKMAASSPPFNLYRLGGLLTSGITLILTYNPDITLILTYNPDLNTNPSPTCAGSLPSRRELIVPKWPSCQMWNASFSTLVF